MRLAGSTSPRWLVIVLLAVVVTRIPLLLTCYSSDGDAWRVAYVGSKFWETGKYSVSRFPGYPLHEILTGPFVLLGGSFLSNLSTLIAALALVLVWHRIAQRQATSPKPLVILLAFTPIFWVDSAGTLDFVWSLLFILLSLSAAQRKSIILSGFWLGCAVGFRPTNALAIAPLFTFLYLSKTSRRDLLVFVLFAVGTAFAAFLPVLLTYGIADWLRLTLSETSDIHLPIIDRSLFFTYRSVYSIGPLAVLSIGTILLLQRLKLRTLLRERDPLTTASVVGVLGFIVMFAFFPLDRSYLLPAVPFLYLIIDRLASQRGLYVAICCVISFAFVNFDVVMHKTPVGTPGFNIHYGLVIEEWGRRSDLLIERTKIATLPFTEKAVVMTGANETFWFENEYVEPDTLRYWRDLHEESVHSKRNPDVHFIVGLPENDVRSLQANGYTVYCLDYVADFLERTYGYKAAELRINILTQ